MALLFQKLGFQCCTARSEDPTGDDPAQFTATRTESPWEVHDKRRFTEFDNFGDGQLWDDVLRELWPAIKGFLETNVLRGIVEPALQRLIWSRMKLERCSLGNEPPRIVGAQAFRRSQDDNDERTVEIALNLDWAGDQVDVKLLIEKGLSAKITKMSIRGTICLELRNFIPESPLMSGLTLYFMNEPEVSILFGGVLKAIEGRVAEVQKIIEGQLASALVVPNRIAVHLSESLSYYDLKYPSPHGILEVELWGASRIPLLHSMGGAVTWMLGDGFVSVEMRLGAEKWCSEALEVKDGRTGNWTTPAISSFLVDELHGQSLIAELRCVHSGPMKKETLLGKTKLSTMNLVDGSVADKTNFAIEMADDLQMEVPETALLNLHAWFRPLFSGSSVEEAADMQPLKDQSHGLLVVILDSVKDLGDKLVGVGVDLTVKVGEVEEATGEYLAQRLTLEDVGLDKSEQLQFLLSQKPPMSPQDAAWVLGLQPDKVAAFAKGSIEATYNCAIRLRVKDPLKDALTLELHTGGKTRVLIATYKMPLRNLLECPQWTLPLEERCFNNVESAFAVKTALPRFMAKVQFFGLTSIEGAASFHTAVSPVTPFRRSRFATDAEIAIRENELKAKPSIFPHTGFRRNIINQLKAHVGKPS